MNNRNPKYDTDYVTLGYLNKTLQEETKTNNEKINTIPKNYNSPPNPPYYENSLLIFDGKIYKCIKSRLTGSFIMSDWEVVVAHDDVSESLKAIFDVNKLEYVEQKDGLIETFYQESDPSLEWGTDLDKDIHTSDLWHNLSDTYQYTKQATNPVTYKWIKRSVPISLFDIIDGYKRIFLKEPSNYKKDDLWFDNVTKMALEASNVFNEAHWQVRDDYIEAVKTEQDEYHKIYILPSITEIDRQTVSEIRKAIDEITLTVSQTYTTKTELNKYIDDVKTDISDEYTTKTDFLAQIDITSKEIKANLDSVTEVVNSTVEGTNERINEINNYLSYSVDEDGVGVVTLGTSNSQIVLKQKNDRVFFEQNGKEVAYISNNKLYITDAEFLNSIQIGNFAFIPRANGSLAFRKVRG